MNFEIKKEHCRPKLRIGHVMFNSAMWLTIVGAIGFWFLGWIGIPIALAGLVIAIIALFLALAYFS